MSTKFGLQIDFNYRETNDVIKYLTVFFQREEASVVVAAPANVNFTGGDSISWGTYRLVV